MVWDFRVFNVLNFGIGDYSEFVKVESSKFV